MLESTTYLFSEIAGSCDWIFRIDNYQRFYVWTTEKVQTYVNDIEATAIHRTQDPSTVHYFGQMIFLKKSQDGRGRCTYEVIDGQQRLTTFLMLAAGIKGIAQNLGASFPEVSNLSAELEQLCLKYLESSKAGVCYYQ